MDHRVAMAAAAKGSYEGALAAPHAGRWLVTLEDERRNWRLTGEWRVPEQPTVDLMAR
jgi:hypothetical protein